MSGTTVLITHLATLLLLASTVTSQSAVVSFVQSAITIQEGNVARVQVQKTGNSDDAVDVVVRFENQTLANADFIGTDSVLRFPAGSATLVRDANFHSSEDDVPEPDKTFIVTMSVLTGNAVVGTPRTATVTIAANDDAYGVIGFDVMSPLRVAEGLSPTSIQLPIKRSRGTFGFVAVTYQITGGSSPASEDLAPVTGTITLSAGVATNTLNILVLPDQIPEDDEEFRVELTSVRGGATLNTSSQSVVLIVTSNDSPLRFAQPEYSFAENAGTVTVEVLRGVAADGVTPLGPSGQMVTVEYWFYSGSAQIGIDCIVTNGSLGFPPGERRRTISIAIVNDPVPELTEEFVITLASPSDNAVLVDPITTLVNILPNDDQHGVLYLTSSMPGSYPSVIVDEDAIISTDSFTVMRDGGSFGRVSIDYIITRNSSDSSLVSDDLSPVTGTVTLLEGQRSQSILININLDTIPEEAESFIVSLVSESVTGGARVGSVTEGVLTIRDSDDAYGVIQFSSDVEQRIVSSTRPRRLQLMLTRSAGLVGQVAVRFSAVYRLPSQGTSGSIDVLDGNPNQTTIIPAGSTVHPFHIPILDNAFLSLGATFDITLLSVDLMDHVTLLPPSSPRLGAKTAVTLEVTNQVANGEIGFDLPNQHLFVDEPEGAVSAVLSLNITREGTSGDATIFWRIVNNSSYPAQPTTGDIAAFSGFVFIASGIARTQINIEILPDNLAETDEKMVVQLYDTQPANQLLRLGDTEAVVTILENDGPGGYFEFSSLTAGPYVVSEGSDLIELTILRRGGSLVARSVRYYAVGDSMQTPEFYGLPQVATFAPGETLKTISFLAAPDLIPELNETFQLTLASFGNPPSDLGARTTIEITVLENDDPHGVFTFPEDPMIRNIDETKGAAVHSATFPVVRNAGRFGRATVSWNVSTIGAVLDITPVSGTLTYEDGISLQEIQISAQGDEIPENPEAFQFILTNPTRGSRLGNVVTATLNINKNDDAIFFEEPTTKVVNEPSFVSFVVRRNGTAASVASVDYRTVAGTATNGLLDYAIMTGTLQFGVGVRTQFIAVRIIDDPTPEDDEYFTIELYNPMGDVVVYGAPIATVTIAANDDPYGIFSFREALTQVLANEGESVFIEIQRARGAFGSVRVYWQIVNNATMEPLPEGSEFEVVAGSVEFADQQTLQRIQITARMDGIPEFKEYYKLVLVNVTEGALTDPVSISLEIGANNDPYGVLVFPSSSTEREIAEDFNPGNNQSAVAVFTVERAQGRFGSIQVLWEVFSDSISGILPTVRDLIFLAEPNLSVNKIEGAERPDTGTDAMQFTGLTNSYLEVPSQHQFSAAVITSGFSMSAWVQPGVGVNGFLLAKDSIDNVTTHYGLKVAQAGGRTSIEYRYSGTLFTNTVVDFTLSSSMDLFDGSWHLILLTIDNMQAACYVDGILIAKRTMDQVQGDGMGRLYVGAVRPGMELYRGLMQDVRMYARKLQAREISEILTSPSKQDLSPISGMLTFDPGQDTADIMMTSLEDNEEEGNEVFTVMLLSSSGGARIARDDATALLTVLKSDNANGLFGFNGPCTPTTLDSQSNEALQYTCSVVRSRGDEGIVTIPWEVRDQSTGEVATSDFVNATGEVVFPNGIRTQTITLVTIDDMHPELLENFMIVLLSQLPLSDDGLIGTTDTSGASIASESDTNNLTIPANDYPNGLLQFATSRPPGPTDPIIPPAMGMVMVGVGEEVGTVGLLVVRAQGLLGEVQVEWRTIDGSAQSAGKDPIDFVSAGGTLTFADQQRFTYITITIVDNDIAELDKTFRVQLSSPTQGAEVGIGSTIEVTIEGSDNAYGTFQFANVSLDVTAIEADVGSSTTMLQVLRLGGALAQVTVDWVVTSDPNDPNANVTSDLVKAEGSVTFRISEMTADISVEIASDEIPELDETFFVRLSNVSRGRLGDASKLVARVTIGANDDPYGAFIFSTSSRSLVVEEAFRNVTLTIERQFGSEGVVQVFYSTLNAAVDIPNMPAYTSRATENRDFLPRQGSVIFSAGQLTASVNVVLLNDDIPERAESVFIYIVSVSLLSSSQANPVLNSPRVGTEHIAEIYIPPNDNASGVLQLSTSAVRVSEDSMAPFLNVTRVAGAFGTVTVTFQHIPDTAHQGQDYSVTSTNVILYDGETHKAIPIEILNDRVPEVAESFQVVLLNQTTGGAILGSPTSCVVTIEPSDDPYGSFGFGFSNVQGDEPENGNSRQLTLSVIRNGGDVGVVSVIWEARIKGELATDDVFPTGGTLFFLSFDVSQIFTLDILPDDVPEEREYVILTLVNATGGGVIGNPSTATISIEANDNPHGIVEFTTADNTVQELENVDSMASIMLTRSAGTFGELEVTFDTRPLDLITEVTRMGETAISYYQLPITGSQLGIAMTTVNVTGQSNPQLYCAESCLRERACGSFSYQVISGSAMCIWSVSTATDNVDASSGFRLFVKNVEKAQALYDSQAQPGLDYIPINSGAVRIPDGAAYGYLNVTILDDTIPERDEVFLMQLASVRLVGATPQPNNLPTLGNQKTTRVTIASNDDANGIWHIFSNSPEAVNKGQLVLVAETQGVSVSVELVVERQGGSIGDVGISWQAVPGTATPGDDYSASGGTLNFASGQTRQVINIGIRDDSIPEIDQVFAIELYNPTGGSELGLNSQVDIRILANDYVAGIVKFATLSYIVREGEEFNVTIERSAPGMGQVTLDWAITGVNGHAPSQSFQQVNGSLVFLPEQLVDAISLLVLSDDTPEINEEFQITLSNIQTMGISPTGAAILDQQGNIASITIQASDEPHGIFSFAQGSEVVSIAEGNTTVQLFVDRKFGSIGRVRVFYEAKEGSLDPTLPDVNLAKDGQDFIAESNFVDFEDGQSVGEIMVTINEDEIPELNEVFLVNLTAVRILSPATTDTLPKLGSTGTLSEVTIEANDGTQGVVLFAGITGSLDVVEGNKTLQLTVSRARGTYGAVTVFIYSQPVDARKGSDYSFSDQVLSFADGETTRTVNVEIHDDNIAEADETFELILNNPTGGLQLGDPAKVTITILASDDANGIINFASPLIVRIQEPTDTANANSIAQLMLVRERGTFGDVQVPFALIHSDRSRGVVDLTPVDGFVTIAAGESTGVLRISATPDDIPELEEEFYVLLATPQGGAMLGQHDNATIIIERNDAPYGSMQIFPRGFRQGTLDIEETNGTVYFTVGRSKGRIGTVTVDWQTVPGTATAAAGNLPTLATVQTIPGPAVHNWCTYTVNQDVYLVVVSGAQTGQLTTAVGSDGSAVGATSMLYRWQGEFLPVQTIETDSAMACTALDIQGTVYLVIANHGSVGRYETMSRIYRVDANGTLSVMQDVPSSGATAATFFTIGSDISLLLANQMTNTQQTNIDSTLMLWTGVQFVSVANVATIGASDLKAFTINGDQYVAVASYYDSARASYEIKSVVYKWSSGSLTEYQQLDTLGAVSIDSFSVGTAVYLVFANSRNNVGESSVDSYIYRWNPSTSMFVFHQALPTQGAQSVRVFVTPDGITYLAIANANNNSKILQWEPVTAMFIDYLSLEPANSVVPFAITNYNRQELAMLAVANFGDGVSVPDSVIYQMTGVDQLSDFIPRSGRLTFNPTDTELSVAVTILDDNQPEDDQSFTVALSNPTGGAELGMLNSVVVNILSNDDAHGVIAFTQDSLNVQAIEQATDSTIILTLARQKGSAGVVVVAWQASGEHDSGDIRPTSGMVEFADGVSTAAIVITITADSFPELDEVSLIKLTSIINPGTTHPDRGATISTTDNTASLTVLANDSPHGVFAWTRNSLYSVVNEPEGSQPSATVVLHIMREQGSRGAVNVRYKTSRAVNLSDLKQAAPNRDFISQDSYVRMADGVTTATITISVLPDTDAEGPETFLVNLTSVDLITGTPVGGAAPSIKIDQDVAEIVITQNDNANGILQFNATKNLAGDVEVYEGSGTRGILSLPVSRTAGALGLVGVNWLATTVSASTTDFSPLSGNVSFIQGQREAFIEIAITDDTIYENAERFTVSLHNPTGGAVLGAETSVIVKILKNDSPKGLFGFLYTQETVMESLSPSDPNGQVTLIIERTQGTRGIIEVEWSLGELGQMDLSPTRGTLTFQEGATRRTLTLRAVQDDELEGEERYTVSIQSVTDDAEISPVFGKTTIVIQPDAGSSGVISILPASRYILIGEPTDTHDGTATLLLTRGAGIFSRVTVNWQLTPRGDAAFTQTSGTVVFEDLQQNATIMLQTIDDSVPELKQTYILQLSSVTGGAAIDPNTLANQATIVVVASDNPHGVFEFSTPPEAIVSEDLPTVNLEVVRNSGITGAVKVTYTTQQMTAQPGQDYIEDSGDLIFADGVDVNTIKISLVPDEIPEGPESFFVNLTSIELLQPVNNDYTMSNGLSLDMPPVIGPISVKTVTIATNDNAQGIIQFAQSDVFEFSESVGTAVIPIVRTAGTFGLVQVSYTSRNLTATPGGVDYSLTDGSITFLDGQSRGSIRVNIINDQLKEFSEVFEITLTQTLGGAVLGRNVTATVVILKSDGPDGLIGFAATQLTRILPNPDANQDIEFTIELSGGIDEYLTGAEVRWRILGPNSQTIPPDTSDISTLDGQRQGSVSFDPVQRGTKGFTLRVKPYPGPEVEEVFIIEIYQVIGAGEISEEAGRATLEILKHGDPNGVVRFYGESITPRSFEEPADGGSLTVSFPLRRREGNIGDIYVHWEVRDLTSQLTTDVSPANGTLRIPDGVTNTQILLTVLADLIPELREELRLVFVSVDGGAEIDPLFNVSIFYIQPNDNPHGIFSVYQANQTVAVDSNMKRYLRILITRNAGTEGDVTVTFDLKYNDGITGAYVPSSGSVLCPSGQTFCTQDILLLNNDLFLRRDTSFNVTMTTLNYRGPSQVTIPPVMLPGAESALIVVPQEAANSIVGFILDATTVDDVSYRAVLTIERLGSYGSIDVLWEAGYPINELPKGYLQGPLSQTSGQLNAANGVSTIMLPIVLNPSGNPMELFAVHLTSALTSAEGGAMLRRGYTTAPIEPYGVVGFSQVSRLVTVAEASGELSLTIERQLGTLGSIRVTYETHASTAMPGQDYIAITSGALTMAAQTRMAAVLVTILEEQQPELAKVFYVNITSVARLPIDGTQGISPRLSSRYAVSQVTIEGSNDPYGVLSMDPDVIEIAESEATCKFVMLNIQRTGGSHGDVSIRVRTIGGGEPWQSDVVPQPSDTSNTIENALANTKNRPQATASQDYREIDVAIVFRDGERMKSFQVEVCDDGLAEPAEIFYVYLSEPMGGVRVAQGVPDGNLKGFTHFTILGSDNYNGVISFASQSRFVTVDEDTKSSVTLMIDRGQAFFGQVMVEWQATYSSIGDISGDADLISQLEQAQGMVTCPPDQRMCTFDVTLRQDEEPEFASWFLVELVGVGQGATLNTAQRFANITTTDSDYPYGLLQFTTDTRFQSVHSSTKRVSLRIERVGGSTKDSAVSWGTLQLDTPSKLAGLTTYPAIAGTDYTSDSGILDFSSGVRRIPVDIVLLPENQPSSSDYPKILQVKLTLPTNGATIHAEYGTANIALVRDERTADIWENRYSALVGLSDDNIYNILLDMADHVRGVLTDEQLAVVMDTIRMIVDEGGRRRLRSNLMVELMEIYCTLMDPARQDTRGIYQLATSFSSFAYILVTDLPCETPEPQTLSCDHAKVGTARWSRGRINGNNFQGKSKNSFTMPANLLDTSASSTCEDIHFIEYSSQQWFYGTNEGNTLNNQVLSVAIKGAEQNFTRLSTPVIYRIYTDNGRVTPRGASCVIFNGPTQQWRPDSCQVLNDQGDFVECSCTHLSDYAAQGDTDNLVGYNAYIYASCFVCIAGLLCAIIAHNVCSVYSMFSAKLLMHMCFAAMALQTVFVISAYISSYISTAACAALGVFIHYFFLAQFSWMLVLAFNLWKVFVINDEHTDRYYILFFVIGWCLPVIAIVIYVVIAYAAFGWPFLLDSSLVDLAHPAVIYGDVHLNGDICFMPNGYAALASAVGPAILCLLVAATVFIQAYQVKPQWKRYDDIYMGSYNTTEVQLLLVFWAIICITCLFGGLHMAYSQLWMLIIFVIFNIIQGLYVFVVYTVLRNQICRPRKGNYSLNPAGFDNPVMLLDNTQYGANGLMATGSEKGSRILLTKSEQPPGITMLGNQDLEWDAQSIGRQSQHSQHSQHSKTNQSLHSRPGSVASRTRPGPSPNNLYAPAPFQDATPFHDHAPPHDDDTDSQDFDDLIFALKTGGAYVSDEGESRSRPSSRGSGWHDDSRLVDTNITGDTTQDHYEMRRIQIADTHL